MVRQHAWLREVVPLLAGRGGEGEMQSGVPSTAAHGRLVRGSLIRLKRIYNF
jgi:hypothetical protein